MVKDNVRRPKEKVRLKFSRTFNMDVLYVSELLRRLQDDIE